MSDKVQALHVARNAILYVRQSSAYQVTHNLESQKLQDRHAGPAPTVGVTRDRGRG
jgi:hypothetical protein